MTKNIARVMGLLGIGLAIGCSDSSAPEPKLASTATVTGAGGADTTISNPYQGTVKIEGQALKFVKLPPPGGLDTAIYQATGPVAGAKVTIYRRVITGTTISELQLQTVTTDAQGRFAFLDAPVGHYIIKGVAPAAEGLNDAGDNFFLANAATVVVNLAFLKL